MAGLAEPLGRICLADFGNYDDSTVPNCFLLDFLHVYGIETSSTEWSLIHSLGARCIGDRCHPTGVEHDCGGRRAHGGPHPLLRRPNPPGQAVHQHVPAHPRDATATAGCREAEPAFSGGRTEQGDARQPQPVRRCAFPPPCSCTTLICSAPWLAYIWWQDSSGE